MTERAFTRRDAVRGAAGAYVGLALGGAVPGWARKRPRLLRGGRFPSGVMAGPPGQHSVLMWTCLEQGTPPGLVELEVARDPDFRRVVRRMRVPVDRRRDFTVRQRIANRRVLRPGRDYWYRFETRTTRSQVGHFRTRRPADSREPVRIAFFSCQGWEAGYYTAHAGLAREDLDLVVSLGDYIYEETDDVGPRQDRTGVNRDGNAQTLAEYRQKYRLYRSDADLRAMHAAHAFVHVPDDHEIESSYHGPRRATTARATRRDSRGACRSPSASAPRHRPCSSTTRCGASPSSRTASTARSGSAGTRRSSSLTSTATRTTIRAGPAPSSARSRSDRATSASTRAARCWAPSRSAG